MRAELSLLLGLILLMGCPRAKEEEEPESGPKLVRCASLSQATVRDTIEVRGTVAPLADRDAVLAPEVIGRIEQVLVMEGDAVKKGQVVARIDDAVLQDNLRQARAALDRARAEEANTTTTLARVQRVFERGIAARQEVDDASAKDASAKAARAEAEAQLHQAERQVERASVKSPLAGTVLRVLRKTGELVDGTPATPVLEIADLSALELVAEVPAQDLVRLQRGATATISFPALSLESVRGTVARVAPAVDRATGIGAVRVRLDGLGKAQPPVGAFGTARVDHGVSHSALLVPAIALRAAVAGKAEVVVCGADHRAHPVAVRWNGTREGVAEIEGPLPAEASVAVDPVLGLVEGDIIEAPP
ncbi:MAG: efflux RND transporter periplasmic adaptor subunit [Myxococcota bacterium]